MPSHLFRYSAFLIAALIATPAIAAEDGPTPRIDFGLQFELQTDWAARSENADLRRNDTYVKVEPEIIFRATEELSLKAHGSLERVRPPGPAEDREFQEHGLFLEELVLQYEGEDFEVFGGKFRVPFGIAWKADLGVYGRDFTKPGYELTERIGFGGTLKLKDDDYGRHAVTASAFFIDTTGMNQSIFTTRPRLVHDSGGPGNTEDPSSFGIALDGAEMPFAPGWRYHAAVVNARAGRGDAADETGFAVALVKTIEFDEDWKLDTLAEFVRFDDFGGRADRRRHFVTPGFELAFQDFRFSSSITLRTTRTPGEPDVGDHLVQAGIGYVFAEGVRLDIGWKRASEDGITTDTYGARFRWDIEF